MIHQVSLSVSSLCFFRNKVLRRLDPQSRKDGEEGGDEKKEDDKTQKDEGSEGKNVTALNQNNSQDGRGDLVRESHDDEGEDGAHATYQRKTWTVASKDESTLLACLKTLYTLIFLDISHRTGRMPHGTSKKHELLWGGRRIKIALLQRTQW